METTTIFKDHYEKLVDREFELMTDNAKLQGTIIALSKMEDQPEFVFKLLKELAEKIENNS